MLEVFEVLDVCKLRSLDELLVPIHIRSDVEIVLREDLFNVTLDEVFFREVSLSENGR